MVSLKPKLNKHIVAIVVVVASVGILYLVLANLLFSRTYEMLSTSMKSRGKANVSQLAELVSWGLAAGSKKDVTEAIEQFKERNPETLAIAVLEANRKLLARTGSEDLTIHLGEFEPLDAIASRMKDGQLVALAPSRSEFIDHPVGYVIYCESSLGYLTYRRNMFIIAVLASVLGLLIVGKLLHAQITVSLENAKLLASLAQANDELRVQITKRSEQLFYTLAMIGRGKTEVQALEPGAVIGERYEVSRHIGEGGMGVVYEVKILSNGQKAALKVAKSGDSSALARLAQEARMAIEVQHENIVRIIDVDIADQGFLYVVMEYLEGKDLAEMRDQWGNLEWGLQVLRQVCSGLHELHKHNLVHRDLKPTNLIVINGDSNRDLKVKITDFGISSWATTQKLPSLSVSPQAPNPPDSALSSFAAEKPAVSNIPSQPPFESPIPGAAESPDFPLAFAMEGEETLPPAHTQTGGGVSTFLSFDWAGTPRFMAPEQIQRGEPPGQATDIWAIGVIAYRILANRWPIDDESFTDLLTGVGTPKPKPMGQILPNLDSKIAAAIDRCLDYNPSLRPTAKELADLL
ncbi:MAG: serine/threonine protein kinase [Myxococcota bacterium]|jgi:serine/threonine protein kinase|nr:serine/threonine protein kinase [Myxococcota bacterium]